MGALPLFFKERQIEETPLNKVFYLLNKFKVRYLLYC
jgi:hypothetical protein